MKANILFFFFILSGLAIAAHMDVIGEKAEVKQYVIDFSAAQATVFPNPSTDYIQLKHAEGIDQLMIYNVLGQPMKHYEVKEDQRYAVLDLPTGTYLASLMDHRSEIVRTIRFQKQ